jgi:hypothetical protein
MDYGMKFPWFWRGAGMVGRSGREAGVSWR